MLAGNNGSSDQQQVVSQGSSSAGQAKPILALKGQLMHWRVLVANTGENPQSNLCNIVMLHFGVNAVQSQHHTPTGAMTRLPNH